MPTPSDTPRPPPLSDGSPWRKGALARINAKYQAVIDAGYPVTLGGVAETLQVARDVDRTNWLTLLGICDEAFFAGWDLELIPGPGIRCTSNRCYRVTFNEAATVIRGLRSWGLEAWANWGRLKDAVRDAQSRGELDAIDVEAGWP